jgi:hypothetical protein
MRKLWQDHVSWTRLYIISAAENLPDKKATTARLLQNQTDIGNAIKPFYGDAAGNKLTDLLRQHILIAADVVTAAKAGDSAKLTSARGRWFKNSNDIAYFLSRANPKHWKAAEMKSMMNEHLNMTFDEAAAYLKKDYAGSVRQYDKAHAQILDMADMLTAGIIGQFPAKLK